MRNIDSKSRPRTQFRFKYLAVRIRLLRLGGSLTTFSTVSTQSGNKLPLRCPVPGTWEHDKTSPIHQSDYEFGCRLAACRSCSTEKRCHGGKSYGEEPR